MIEVEADEMWSFVGNKKNKKWIWIAMEKNSRQIIAFHVGDRSADSAKALWEKIPEEVKRIAVFFTDEWEAYQSTIPKEQHFYYNKCSLTNHIERFNNTLRHRVSRLVRLSLSFSKSLLNHIGAIKYFFCHYNLSLQV